MRNRVIFVACALALLGVACGGDDDAATANDAGVVEITMKDSRFDPAKVEVKAGEALTFRFANEGELDHEAFIGTESDQDAHEEEMRGGDGSDMTEMSHGSGTGADSGGDNEITLASGESGELTYTFDQAGTILIGCHEPGHYRGGMKATVTVTEV